VPANAPDPERELLVNTAARRLILLAHGSPNPQHGEAMTQISQRVAANLPPGWQTTVAYLQHQQPVLSTVLSANGDTTVPTLVLPVLISNGEHNQDDVPAVTAGRPLTPVPALTPDLLLNSVLEAVRAAADHAIDPNFQTIVLATGGSAAQDIAQHFDALRARVEDELRSRSQARLHVSLICRPADLGALVRGTQNALVVPLLVAPGVLAGRFRAAAGELNVPVSEPIGQTAAFARALAQRALATDAAT